MAYKIGGMEGGEEFPCAGCGHIYAIPTGRLERIGRLFRKHIVAPSMRLLAATILSIANSCRRGLRRTIDLIFPEKAPVAVHVASAPGRKRFVRAVVLSPLMISLAVHMVFLTVATTIVIIQIFYEDAINISIEVDPGKVLDQVLENRADLNVSRKNEYPSDLPIAGQLSAPASKTSGMDGFVEEFAPANPDRPSIEERSSASEFQRSEWVDPTPTFSPSHKTIKLPKGAILERPRPEDEIAKMYDQDLKEMLRKLEEPPRKEPLSYSEASEIIMRTGLVKSCPASRIISTVMGGQGITDDFIKSLVKEQLQEGGKHLSDKEWRKLLEDLRERMKPQQAEVSPQQIKLAAVIRQKVVELDKTLAEDLELARSTILYIDYRFAQLCAEGGDADAKIEAEGFERALRDIQLQSFGKVLERGEVDSIRELLKLKYKEAVRDLGDAPKAKSHKK